MKTLSALFFLSAMTAAILLHIQIALQNHPWSSIDFRPSWLKRNRTKTTTLSFEIERQPAVPQSYHSLMVHAARHYTTQNYAAALAHYRLVLVLLPNDAAALSGEAWSYYYLGQEEQAMKDFQALLKLDANDSWAREGMSLCKDGNIS